MRKAYICYLLPLRHKLMVKTHKCEVTLYEKTASSFEQSKITCTRDTQHRQILARWILVLRIADACLCEGINLCLSGTINLVEIEKHKA